ncbi:hypothetical protein [Sulfurimonas sp.]|uniref:hypothetical protein n=1 Tax=Sulfurimonas sp. TaxID=2022749 RepID=UPI002AAF78A3|nr:hypothetical protein [Sulfurimonas sp.]
MKIAQSDVVFSSTHYKKHEVLEKESLVEWSKGERDPRQPFSFDRLELSDEFNSMEEISIDLKLQMLVLALEALMGIKINISPLTNTSQRVGWGIDYSYEKKEIREEHLNFSASGNVQTEDGREIDFSMAFSMKSSSESHERLRIVAGDALLTDPLVLNFDSGNVTISNIKHEFDLDLDGKSDEFSFVGSGSGFLALDKNKDGKINDGSELFGPKSGNGFNELRAYDSDNNGWIDENDDVFEQLLIWTKDENGKENLFSLSDKNIGALYLGSVLTSFDFRANNELQGQLKESSIYLKEDGKVGTLQEIDLVV